MARNSARIERSQLQRFGVEWVSPLNFTLEGYTFKIPRSLKGMLVGGGGNFPADCFYLAKNPDILARYFALFSEKPYRRILELGIFRGGSAAFTQLVAKPERMLAVELATERAEVLDRFIEDRGLQDTMRLAYGVDQSDADTLRSLCTGHFGVGRSMDLVIDDASHILAPTRSSFDTTFPLLAPGGSYIIEDYAALPIMLNELAGKPPSSAADQLVVAELVRRSLQDDGRPMHAMVMEAVLGSIADPGIIRRVVVDQHWLRIVRGEKDVADPGTFSLRAMAVDHFGLTDSSPVAALRPYLDNR